MYDVVGLQV